MVPRNSCRGSFNAWKHYSWFSCKICLWNSLDPRCITQDLLSRGSSLCSSNTCDYVTCSSVRLYTSSQRHNLVTAMMQGCCQDLQKFCCYRVSWIVQSFLYSSKGKGDQGKTVNAEFKMWLKNSKTLNS